MDDRSQHVGAYVIVVQAARLLVVRKSRGPYTGLLDLPGGRIEHGESPSQAAVRELAEETGLSSGPAGLRLIDTWSHVASWHRDGADHSLHHLGVIFRAENAVGSLLTGGDGEDAASAQWALISELTRHTATPFAARAALLAMAT